VTKWIVALAFLTGCYSKVTAQEGRFTLAYAASVQVENFVKPIAPGAKLDLHAFANGGQDKLTIVGARSSKPGVLRVVSAASETLVVEGIAPGGAELEVTVRDASGATLTDTMFFHVSKPATHGIEHTCTEEPNATYVRGANVDVFHGLATSDRRPVIGYDYAPVAIEPKGALDLVAQPQAGGLYRFVARKTAPRITVRSLVDGSELTMHVIEAADITSAELHAPDHMVAGQIGYAVARVEHGEAPVCSQNALTRARSLTPRTCSVSAKLDDSTGEENREQLAEITALAFGECEFEVTLPELAKGRGIVLRRRIRIGRIEYPKETRAPWRSIGLSYLLPRLLVVALWLALRARRSSAR
jgi:hypothetical protein